MKYLIMLLLVVMTVPSFARKTLNYIPDRSCRSAITETDILACMNSENNFYENKLKRYVIGINGLLYKEDQKVFKKSQEAWGKFRDTTCKLLYQNEGAKLKGILELACRIVKIKNRYKELRIFFEKLGGTELPKLDRP